MPNVKKMFRNKRARNAAEKNNIGITVNGSAHLPYFYARLPDTGMRFVLNNMSYDNMENEGEGGRITC